MTYSRTWMSLNSVRFKHRLHKSLDVVEFGQVRRMTKELAARARLKNQCLHLFSVAIDQVHFGFVSNKNKHDI